MARIVMFVFSAVVASQMTDLQGWSGAWGWDRTAQSQALYFDQRLDHFDAGSGPFRRWQQAYFMNDTYWSGPETNAPIFLYIGGEGPLGGSSVTSNFIVDWLNTTGALLFALEHRYYGCYNASSCPYDVSKPGIDHMRFLSSRQALADLVAFRLYADATYNLPADSKWILIGGSYPGMLAAFGRAEYPQHFFAAVASSAPVIGKLDMTEFQDIVATAYALDVEGVRGSSACVNTIADGHIEVGELLTTVEGRERLAFVFPDDVPSGEWLRLPENQRAFAGCGVASFPAQANKPDCTGPACGISQICELLAQQVEVNKSVLESLAAVRAAQAQGNMISTCEMDWEMPGDIPPSKVNYWGYQTCTEFGFYQTCEMGTKCFYTQGLVSFQSLQHSPSDFCMEQFNITRQEILESIVVTNAYYSEKIEAASQIIWPNGDVDPWSGLSHLTSPGVDQPVIYPIHGASHCAWMRSRQTTDQQSLNDAREQIYNQLIQWLAEEPVSHHWWLVWAQTLVPLVGCVVAFAVWRCLRRKLPNTSSEAKLPMDLAQRIAANDIA